MAIFASDLRLDAALERSRQEKREVSEVLFEACCEKMQIDCKPIPTEQGGKTPDYELSIGGQTIIVEVKELKEDWTPGVGKHEIVGNRVRRKIDQSARQMKTRTAGRHPGMLVLYRDGSGLSYFYDPHLPAAMYGTQTIELEVPRRGGPYAVGQRFGPGKKMTPERHTSISAVGVIFRDPAADWDFDLCVFHNAHAAVPIEAGLLARHGIRQFQMDFGRMEWAVVDPDPDESKNCA